MKKICVNGSVRRYTNPILHMSQPALLCVTAETLVNRLMWQISAATLLFNPVILHQRFARNLFRQKWRDERGGSVKEVLGKGGCVVSEFDIRAGTDEHKKIKYWKPRIFFFFSNTKLLTARRKGCHVSSRAAEPFYDTPPLSEHVSCSLCAVLNHISS